VRRLRLSLYAAFPVALLACSQPPPPTQDAEASVAMDASDDGGADVVDVVLPPGPPGQILGVREEGNVVIPTLRSDVNVVYTEAKIPHVYAANARDSYVVQGYLLARDRYFQIELQRRVGLGTASELLGDRGLALDTLSRGRGYRVIAERLLTQMGPDELETLDAFVEGFNAYVNACRMRRMPPPAEVRLIGLILGMGANPARIMEPITRRDLAGVLALVLANSSFTTDDLDRARAALSFDALYNSLPASSSVSMAERAQRRNLVRSEIFERVQPLTDVTSALGLATDSRMGAMARRQRRVRTQNQAGPRVDRAMLDRLIASNELLERLRRGDRGGEYGSNAWALSGRGTADGAAILSGDGHLPLSVPTLLYQMHTDTTVFAPAGSAGQSLIGLFFPGIPWMGLGTNGSVAWSFTYLYGDLTDWYSERIQLDAMGRPAQSFFQGSWRPLTAVEETYTVAGGRVAARDSATSSSAAMLGPAENTAVSTLVSKRKSESLNAGESAAACRSRAMAEKATLSRTAPTMTNNESSERTASACRLRRMMDSPRCQMASSAAHAPIHAMMTGLHPLAGFATNQATNMSVRLIAAGPKILRSTRTRRYRCSTVATVSARLSASFESSRAGRTRVCTRASVAAVAMAVVGSARDRYEPKLMRPRASSKMAGKSPMGVAAPPRLQHTSSVPSDQRTKRRSAPSSLSSTSCTGSTSSRAVRLFTTPLTTYMPAANTSRILRGSPPLALAATTASTSNSRLSASTSDSMPRETRITSTSQGIALSTARGCATPSCAQSASESAAPVKRNVTRIRGAMACATMANTRIVARTSGAVMVPPAH